MPDGKRKRRKSGTPPKVAYYAAYRMFRWRLHFWGVEFTMEEVAVYVTTQMEGK